MALNCPFLLPPADLRVLLLAGSVPRELHFPWGFPCTLGMFPCPGSNNIYLFPYSHPGMGGCTWDAPILLSGVVEEQATALPLHEVTASPAWYTNTSPGSELSPSTPTLQRDQPQRQFAWQANLSNQQPLEPSHKPSKIKYQLKCWPWNLLAQHAGPNSFLRAANFPA